MLQKHNDRKATHWYDHFRPKTQAEHMKQQDAMMLSLHHATGQLLSMSELHLRISILPQGPEKAAAILEAQRQCKIISKHGQLQRQQAAQAEQQVQREQLMNDMRREQQQIYEDLQHHGVTGSAEAASGLQCQQA